VAFGDWQKSGALGIFALVVAFLGFAMAVESVVHHIQPPSLLIALLIEGLAVALGLVGLLLDRLRGTTEALTYVGVIAPLLLGSVFLAVEWASVFG
jgi:hypothetical protein